MAGERCRRRRRSVVVADAVVLRGADWLERRWHDGGTEFKHMALAVAAPTASRRPSSRTLARSRRAGPAADRRPTAIPDDVRGLAYVQNHPLRGRRRVAAYDAVNEVYFDDLDGCGGGSTGSGTTRSGRPPTSSSAPPFLAVQEEWSGAPDLILAVGRRHGKLESTGRFEPWE